jgi:hypothetical protein
MTPRANEGSITTLIECRASRVIEPVDLDHELHLGRKEIRNEPTEKRDLPAKGDPGLAAAKSFEEEGLRRRRSVTHSSRALREQHLPPRCGT